MFLKSNLRPWDTHRWIKLTQLYLNICGPINKSSIYGSELTPRIYISLYPWFFPVFHEMTFCVHWMKLTFLFFSFLSVDRSLRIGLWHRQCQHSHLWRWNWWCIRRREGHRWRSRIRLWCLEAVYAEVYLHNQLLQGAAAGSGYQVWVTFYEKKGCASAAVNNARWCYLDSTTILPKKYK